jgi:hypothetical protein
MSTKSAPRKSASNKTRKQTASVHPTHETTYHGLHHWHKHMFEHLGWMVLAKSYGYMDKVESYKHSLARLKDAIEKRRETIKDVDRKRDLGILLANVKLLHEHAMRDL